MVKGTTTVKGIIYENDNAFNGHGTARRHKSQQFQSIQCIPNVNTALAYAEWIGDVDQQNVWP
jgi:hypothetical protein